MTDLAQLTERDLLVRIDTKLEAMEGDVTSLKARVTELERARDRADGMINGGKVVFGILTALPAGAIGLLLGINYP